MVIFTKEELKCGKNMAVVGKNLEGKIKEQDGYKYIKVKDEYFRVIGIIGYDSETIIDDYIYISVKQADRIIDSNLCTLDIWGKENRGGRSVYGKSLGKWSFGRAKSRDSGIFGIGVCGHIIWQMVYCNFVCDLLCIAVISVQWIKRQQRKSVYAGLWEQKFTGFRAYFSKVYIVYGGFNGVKHAHMYACIFRIYVCDFYRIYDDNTGNARCYNNKCV